MRTANAFLTLAVLLNTTIILQAQPKAYDPPLPYPKPLAGTAIGDFEKFKTIGIGPGRLRILGTRLPTTVPAISIATERSFLEETLGADWLRQGTYFGATLYGYKSDINSIEVGFFKRYGVSVGRILENSGSGLPGGLDLYANVGFGVYVSAGESVYSQNDLLKDVTNVSVELAVRPSAGVRYQFSNIGIFAEFGASESGIYRVGISFGKKK